MVLPKKMYWFTRLGVCFYGLVTFFTYLAYIAIAVWRRPNVFILLTEFERLTEKRKYKKSIEMSANYFLSLKNFAHRIEGQHNFKGDVYGIEWEDWAHIQNTVFSDTNHICWHQYPGIAYNPIQLFRAWFEKRVVFSAISN